jgi:glycosyltransferase involved in cell wall biosynthesis
MLNLAGGLAQRGETVDLVLARAEGSFLDRVPNGIRVLDLGAKRVSASLPGLVRYLRHERPAALLAAKEYANIVALCARSLARTQTRVLVTVHTTLSIHTRYAPKVRERFLVPFLARKLYPNADEIIAVSSGVADDLARFLNLPRQRVRVIYNGVVSPEIVSAAHAPLTHSWFVPGAPPVILSVGRLTVAKDYATLIRAFARVRKSRQARLLILGDGEQRQALAGLVRDLQLLEDVSLPGSVDNPYPYFARAAVFALSSIWEGLSSVLIEALALGTPVVATDCASGSREILSGGRHGRLVPVGDETALAEALVATLDSPPSAEQLAAFPVEEFTVHAAVERYGQLIHARSN